MKNENKKNTNSGEVSPIVESIIKGNDAINYSNASGNNAKAPDSSGKRRIFIAAFLLFFITISAYLLWRGTPGEGCMYWTGYRYETVACNKKMEGIIVIARDNDKLQHFEKITCPDTITLKALGHVWYSKINNKPEFFTADGYHPVQIQYHLKPLTKYMIEKYVSDTIYSVLLWSV